MPIWRKQFLSRRRDELKKARERREVVARIYNRFQTNAFALHGTSAENLESIRRVGLRSVYPQTYFVIPKSRLMRKAKFGGVKEIVRDVLIELINNVGYAEAAYRANRWRERDIPRPHTREYLVPFDKIGLVIGRVTEGARGFEEIPPRDIVETITLSHKDIEKLNAKYPGAKGLVPSFMLPEEEIVYGGEKRRVFPSNPEYYKILKSIAQLLAIKAIRYLSRK